MSVSFILGTIFTHSNEFLSHQLHFLDTDYVHH